MVVFLVIYRIPRGCVYNQLFHRPVTFQLFLFIFCLFLFVFVRRLDPFCVGVADWPAAARSVSLYPFLANAIFSPSASCPWCSRVSDWQAGKSNGLDAKRDTANKGEESEIKESKQESAREPPANGNSPPKAPRLLLKSQLRYLPSWRTYHQYFPNFGKSCPTRWKWWTTTAWID